MVFLSLADDFPLDAAAVVTQLKQRGVLITAFGPRRLRLVTHYWIDNDAVDRTVAAFKQIG